MSATESVNPIPKRGRWLRWPGGLLLVALAAYLGWHYMLRPDAKYDFSQVLLFDGDSRQLQATVVLPTLSTPIPEGKSAIWCASFQLAWNRLKDDVANGPIQLANAQGLADQLNSANQSAKDLHPDSVYAAAGLVSDGMVQRIQDEMLQKFPQVPRPEFEAQPGGAVAYAFLAASTKFETPFFDNDAPFSFVDSAGPKTQVGAFGIRRKDEYAYRHLRAQVQILYCPENEIWTEKDISEFIVDPCRTSQPYQLVLGRVNRKATLAETLQYVEQLIANQKPDRFVTDLHTRDALLVPNMAWKIKHHFQELEGQDKQFLNPNLIGRHLAAAQQTIQFRLDRSGAELATEAKIPVAPGVSHFYFDRPFLIVMKQRGSKQPFFVMWVDNAELLQKR